MTVSRGEYVNDPRAGRTLLPTGDLPTRLFTSTSRTWSSWPRRSGLPQPILVVPATELATPLSPRTSIETVPYRRSASCRRRVSILSVSTDAHFTSRMPTKRVAADCLLTDGAGRLLVLDPPYKGTWDIPGGMVEADESPWRAAQREVREEVGLDIEPGDLLVVDWKSRDGDFTEVVALLFDGGHLATREIDAMVVDPSEVRGYRFVELEEAEKLLDAELFARVSVGLAARTTA